MRHSGRTPPPLLPLLHAYRSRPLLSSADLEALPLRSVPHTFSLAVRAQVGRNGARDVPRVGAWVRLVPAGGQNDEYDEREHLPPRDEGVGPTAAT